MFTSPKVAAFTLMECLLALLVLSGAVLTFDSMTRLVSHDIHHQTNDTQKDWLIFAKQLGKELEGSQLVKVENNRLYIRKSGQQLAFGQAKAGDFRKTNDKGQGYQPMLYHLQSATITQEQDIVTIKLIFDDGMERSFIYAFPTTS